MRIRLLALLLTFLAVTVVSDARAGDPPAGSALGWVSGTVTDEEGKPFASADVKVVREKPPGAWSATTDAKGYFAVRGVPAGPAVLMITARGRVAVRQEVKVPATGAVTVEAKLEMGVRFAGKVTDVDSKPVGGAALQAYESSGESRSSFRLIAASPAGSATSGADGLFSVDGLRPGGTYRLRVTHPHFIPLDLPGLPADPGGGHDSLDVTMESAAWLSGVVVDAAGAPVAGAQVRGPEEEGGDPAGLDPFFARFLRSLQRGLDKDGSVTDARGKFEIGSLQPGEAKLTATADAYFEGSVTLDSLVAGKETAGVRVVIEAATAWIEGTVVGGDGKGLSGVELEAEGDVGRAASAKSDATGRFKLVRVRSHGPVAIRATKTGYRFGNAAGVELNSKTCKIELVKSARLKAKVVDAEGKLIPQVVVTLQQETAPNRRSASTSWTSQPAEGLDLELPIGEVTVNFGAEGYDVVEAGKWTTEPGKTIDGGTVTLTKSGE